MSNNSSEPDRIIPPALASILQTAHVDLTPPRHDEAWSSWYTETEDIFADFKSYEPIALGASQLLQQTAPNNDNNNNNNNNTVSSTAPVASTTAIPNAIMNSGGSQRALSARQISGQFDDEVAKSWEEDWEDEDVEDTLDYIMGQMSRYEVAMAAKAVK